MTTLQFGNNTIRLGATPDASAAGAPLSRLFLAARTGRGPVNLPTTIGSYDDFVAVFGAGTNAARTDVAGEVVRDYFKVVGRAADAVVTRLYEGTPQVAAEQEVVGSDPATPAQQLRVQLEAASPGAWGDGLVRSVRQTAPGVYTVEVREVRGGVVVKRKPVAGVTPDAAGAARLNAESGGLLRATFNPAGTVDFLNVAAGADPDVWVTFAGGADSAQLSPQTLEGTLDPDSQERTGLWTLRSTELGGGVLVVPTADTPELNAVKLRWAAETSRFAPIEPGGDLTPGAALAEKQALELVDGASFGAYFYPRGREAAPGGAVSKSALGYVAGLYVQSVMAEPGYVSPPAGALGLPDVQRAPNGRDLLVHEVNASTLQKAGVNTLVQRAGRIELQGLSLLAPNPLQPGTDKVYERLILNALSYDIGPKLGKFNNAYVDAKGVFFSVVIGAIRDVITPYYQRGLLYGETVEQAFRVEMDYTLNNPAEVAKTGRLNVKVKVRISPVGEGIDLELFHVPVNVDL